MVVGLADLSLALLDEEILDLWPALGALTALLLILATETLHARRTRKVARLFFGPRERPAAWVRGVPLLRALAAAALTWGLGTLLLLDPMKHTATDTELLHDGDYKHVLMVLDVSPSMRLVDAGPQGDISRMRRARDVMESFFKRVPLEQYRISVIAVYNGARPVVQDTVDIEVVRNILGDLPMHYAFKSGKTRLFDGLEEAARMAKPWNPNSTTLIIVSDGDTIPANGMPKMPASIDGVVIIGVGDPVSGKFIDGQQSRQNVSTLRQMATRLGGVFHNGNEKHLSSSLIGELTRADGVSTLQRLSRREYALLGIGLGSALMALLPMLLHFLGTPWRPGKGGLGRAGTPLRIRLRSWLFAGSGS